MAVALGGGQVGVAGRHPHHFEASSYLGQAGAFSYKQIERASLGPGRSVSASPDAMPTLGGRDETPKAGASWALARDHQHYRHY